MKPHKSHKPAKNGCIVCELMLSANQIPKRRDGRKHSDKFDPRDVAILGGDPSL